VEPFHLKSATAISRGSQSPINDSQTQGVARHASPGLFILEITESKSDISHMNDSFIQRPRALAATRQALKRSPVVALLGPRQCGKTTLAHQLAGADRHFFDLESTLDRQALSVAGERTLDPLRGLVVLDEVQTMPQLLPVLRVLADRRGTPARFLLLGSASPDLIQGASESLAGRVAFVQLGCFDVTETGAESAAMLWERGGFPRSFLAGNDAESYAWRQDFIETFLSRDAVRFGITLPSEGLRRFWTMLAHLHGGPLNAAELGRALSLDQKTASRYVDILCAAFLLRRLPPWFENTGKRVVKAPKIYLRDSGLLHALLGLRTPVEVRSHPRFGASWEGFALEHAVSLLNAERDAYFWGTHGGAELDLLINRGGAKFGFEFKYTDTPRTTKSMRVAMADLKLKRLFVVHPGTRRFDLDDDIVALPLGDLFKESANL
jgi:predicted AAA+ superfamily ATPase